VVSCLSVGTAGLHALLLAVFDGKIMSHATVST
jgi:hypothetical protein